MAEFGELVMWLPEGKRASRLDSGYRRGSFLGLVEGAAAYYVGVKDKVVKVKTLSMVYVRPLDAEPLRARPWGKTKKVLNAA